MFKAKLSGTCGIAVTRNPWLTPSVGFWCALLGRRAFAANIAHEKSECVPYKHCHGPFQLPCRGNTTQTYTVFACPLILQPLGGGSGVWPPSARGNMLTVGLSNSQPVPPPAADALLITVHRQQAEVEEFWGKEEPGKVFRDALLFARVNRSNWTCVLQRQTFYHQNLVLHRSSSFLLHARHALSFKADPVRSHSEVTAIKCKWLSSSPRSTSSPSRLYCRRLWASKWLNIWREVSAFFMGWGLLLF